MPRGRAEWPALEERFLALDGRPVHVRTAGPGDDDGAPPVVLVHGLVVSGRYLVPTARRLAARRRVLVPDLPGYGLSPGGSRLRDVIALGDALARILDGLGIARADLLGNSFGCQLLADFAMRFPARVRRLVLVSPTYDRRPGVLRTMARWMKDGPREPASLSAVLVRDSLDAGLLRALFTLRLMLREDLIDKAPLVHAPALVVRGARDPVCTEAFAREVAALLPRGRLVVIPGAPHAINYAAPLELSRVVLAFLEEERRALPQHREAHP